MLSPIASESSVVSSRPPKPAPSTTMRGLLAVFIFVPTNVSRLIDHSRRGGGTSRVLAAKVLAVQVQVGWSMSGQDWLRHDADVGLRLLPTLRVELLRFVV